MAGRFCRVVTASMSGKIVASSLAVFKDFSKAFNDIVSTNRELSNEGIKRLILSLQSNLQKRKESRLKDEDPTLCDDFDYALVELSKALLTNASPGIILALKEVMSVYPGDSSGVIKKILVKEFPSLPEVSQQEIFRAKMFLILAFIKSRKVAQIKEDVSLIQTITKELIQGFSTNMRDKSFDGLLGLLESIKYPTFLQKVLPQLVSVLKGKWSADVIIFVEKLSTIFRELDLPQYFKSLTNRLVVHPNHAKLLVAALNDADVAERNQLWELILKNSDALSPEQRDTLLTDIWQRKYDENTGITSDLMKELNVVLAKIRPQARPALLTPRTLKVLHSNKNSNVEEVQNLYKSIIAKLNDSASDPASILSLFDKQLDLTLKISPSAALSLASTIFGSFEASPTTACDNLVRLVKQGSNSEKPADTEKWRALVLDILRTLYALAYWRFTKLGSQQVPQLLVKFAGVNLDAKSHELCADTFFRVLDVASQKNNNPLLYQLVNFQQFLISSKGATLLQPISNEAESSRIAALKIIETIQAAENSTPQQRAMQLLLSSLLVQLFTEAEEISSQLFDVVRSYDIIVAPMTKPSTKEKGKKPTSAPENDKNEAFVVLMEVLLAQKTIAHTGLLVVPNFVAASFASELPIEALQVCIEALERPGFDEGAGKEEQMDIDSEEDDEVNEEVDTGSQNTVSANEEKNEEDEEEDDEDEEGDGDGDGDQDGDGDEDQDGGGDEHQDEEAFLHLDKAVGAVLGEGTNKGVKAARLFKKQIVGLLLKYIKKTTNASTLLEFTMNILNGLTNPQDLLKLTDAIKRTHFESSSLEVTEYIHCTGDSRQRTDVVKTRQAVAE